VRAPLIKGDPAALEVLDVLLHRVMIRHSKGQRMANDTTQTILNLPARATYFVPVPLNKSLHESAVYGFLEGKSIHAHIYICKYTHACAHKLHKYILTHTLPHMHMYT
jgi:hypothetical protein